MSHFDADGRLLQSRRGPIAHKPTIAARGARPPLFPLGHDAMRTLDRLRIEEFEILRENEPEFEDPGYPSTRLLPRSSTTTTVRIGPCELHGDEALVACAIIFSNPRESWELE
jgi:hypothetical protein